MKTCSRCKKELSIDNFYKSKQNKDGLKGRCKKCHYLDSINSLARYEKSEKGREKKILYRIKNKEKSKEYQRLLVIKRKNYFIEKYNISYVTSVRYGLENVIKLYKKYSFQCAVCSSKEKINIHHKDGIGITNYKKLNRDIDNSLDNLVLLCSSCHHKLHWQERKK